MVYSYKIHSDDGGGIHVLVSKNYEEYYIDNKVLKSTHNE